MTEKYYIFRITIFLLVGLCPVLGISQISADLETTQNSNCAGEPCNYNGPSILINELMLSPTNNDGSMWGGNSNQKGEWIELYNPNICQSVDISCYYLGNNAKDGGSNYPGGYVIPPGTVVPPAGYALIRGVNAASVPSHRLVQNGGNVVELVVTGDGVCVGDGSRLWFPNVGGWFAFYDNNGVPQDAVSWGNQADLEKYPCTPTLSGCGFSGTLPSYNDFPAGRKNFILSSKADDYKGQSIRRIPDGGNWSGPGTPTYANCNSTCVNPFDVNCNGTITVNPTGGQAPYTYLWDDPREQTTATATHLCAGEYCVTITDNNGNTHIECITVEDVSFETHVNAAICEGASYTLPNSTSVSTAGEYPIMFQSQKTCDSLVVTHLTVNPVYETTLNPEICHGTSYTLPNGVEATTSNTYHVSLQTQEGCDSLFTVHLTVKPPIEINISASICEGDTYTLPNGDEVTNAQQYTVVIPGNNAVCDTTYIVDLSFYPKFEIGTSIYDDISCHGLTDGEIKLAISGSTGPYTYQWNTDFSESDHLQNLSEGEYNVTVTDIHNCTAQAQFEINEPTPVAISATADELICFNSFATLEAQATGGTGDFQYHWSHTSSNAATQSDSPGEDKTYTVYATDANSCETETITLEVAVMNMFDDFLLVSQHDSICIGNEIEISAFYNGEYVPYTYTWSDGLASTGGPHVVSPQSDKTYTVEVEDQCGNRISKDIPVSVIPLPQLDIENIWDVTCHGANDGKVDIAVNSVMPIYNFAWSHGEPFQNQGQNLAPGNYEVTVTDDFGCENAIEFVISEPEKLITTLSGDSLICINSQAELIAQSTGGTGAVTYHWAHTNAQLSTIQVSPLAGTSYVVYAQDENGCTSAEAGYHVSVISMDEANLTAVGDTMICLGETGSISAAYDGIYGPYIYEWSHDLQQNPGPHEVSPQESTIYTVTISDNCNNSLSANVAVGVFDQPVIQIPDNLISGCSPLEFSLMDSLNVGAGFTHHWTITNGETISGNPITTSIETPGIYLLDLTVTSPDGCVAQSENSIPIEVYELPTADFSASKWSTGIDEPNISFTNTGSGYVFSHWLIDNSLFENQNQISYAFPDTGKYDIQLFVENEFGCTDSITRRVVIEVQYDITIPNAFTPSGNGDNPYYDPTSTSNTVFYPFSEYVVDYEMNIFNRWGELIFESTEFEKGWNGTYRDQPCPQDVYVYKIKMVYADGNKVTKVGDVTLFR